MQTKDPALEQKIVSKGFSYGQQLGRVVDALQVLVRHAEDLGLKGKLDAGEWAAFEQFDDMAGEIDRLKVGELPLSERGLENFIRRMAELKDRDNSLYWSVRRQVARLQKRLKALDESGQSAVQPGSKKKPWKPGVGGSRGQG